ncbi:hypothetical protein KUV26_01250 [Leisingera daeponensis]|uniref:Uncharacterized protein n=1 Tax=Leisingera daeponensis TaxID=405746 RepID=A0ABS7NBB8_9RHOB|nr:hypothetical protein [Leisingera daeponensis]MBY6138054.1 hypothetical protein [Leisingera daeponensis]
MPKEPKVVGDILKDKKMTAAYMDYCKRRYCLNEFMFTQNKGNPESLWTRYMDQKKGKEPVNITSKTHLAAKALADKGDFKSGDWKKIIETGKKEVVLMLNKDVMGFTGSDEYKKYVAENGMGDPQKAAKLLGITDVKKLKEVMVNVAVDDRKTAEKLWKELAKKEKILEDYKAISSSLKKANLV